MSDAKKSKLKLPIEATTSELNRVLSTDSAYDPKFVDSDEYRISSATVFTFSIPDRMVFVTSTATVVLAKTCSASFRTEQCQELWGIF